MPCNNAQDLASTILINIKGKNVMNRLIKTTAKTMLTCGFLLGSLSTINHAMENLDKDNQARIEKLNQVVSLGDLDELKKYIFDTLNGMAHSFYKENKDIKSQWNHFLIYLEDNKNLTVEQQKTILESMKEIVSEGMINYNDAEQIYVIMIDAMDGKEPQLSLFNSFNAATKTIEKNISQSSSTYTAQNYGHKTLTQMSQTEFSQIPTMSVEQEFDAIKKTKTVIIILKTQLLA